MWSEIPSVKFNRVLWITRTHGAAVEEAVMHGMQQKLPVQFSM